MSVKCKSISHAIEKNTLNLGNVKVFSFPQCVCYFAIFVQFFFFPVFFSYNIFAKFFLTALFIACLLLSYDFRRVQVKVSPFLLVLVVLLTIFSSLQAYHMSSALNSSGIFLLMILFGVILVPNIYPRGLHFGFFSLFLILILVVSILGLYQYSYFIFMGIMENPLIPYLLPPVTSSRVSGIYGQPNLFALLLVVGIIAYIFFYLHGNKIFKTNNFLYKKLFYVPIIVVTLCFFLTQSRAGLLAFLLVLSVMIFYFNNRNYFSKKSAYRLRIFKIFLSIIGSYILFILLNNNILDIPSRGLGDVGFSADARFVFWTASLLIFLDHPLFGVGLDNFKFYLPKYNNAAHDFLGFVEYEAMGHTEWSHNEILQIFCETGILGFFLISLVFIYLFYLLRIVRIKKKVSLRHFFSYILILPFFIQAMFSWPLRHPSLLLLFFLFLGSFFALQRGREYTTRKWGTLVIRSMAVCCIGVIFWLGYCQIQIGTFYDKYSKENLRESFSDFSKLSDSSYLKYTLLFHSIPSYVNVAAKEKDVDFGRKILPYSKQLVELQGTHWQWFNLALLYLLLDHEDDAMSAVDQAIYLRPTEQTYWSFQHYLNMLKASKKTGRPLEDFLPIPPGGTAKDLSNLFDFFDQSNSKLSY